MIRHILAGSIRLLVPRAQLVLVKTHAAALCVARGTWVSQQKALDGKRSFCCETCTAHICALNDQSRILIVLPVASASPVFYGNFGRALAVIGTSS